MAAQPTDIRPPDLHVTGMTARRPVRETDYRSLMSCFPTGVAVVTTVDQLGRLHGMTCTSLCSVSVDPPTLLVSLHVHSGTRAAVRSSNCFAVNLLHDRARPTAELFSSPTADRFARVVWRRSGAVGAPWLADDALALAECVVRGTMEAGDHTLILGEVVDTAQVSGAPLLYGLRQFASWPAGLTGQAAG